MSLLEELKSITPEEMRIGLDTFAERAALGEEHIQIANTLGRHYVALAMLPGILQERYTETGEYTPDEASSMGDGAMLALAILKTIGEVRLEKSAEGSPDDQAGLEPK